MAEHIGVLAYAAIVKEVTKGTALTPTTYVPLYSEKMTTDIALDELLPAVGVRFKRFENVPGLRSHKGEITVLAEPNTTAQFVDMLMVAGADSGTTPVYTHPFTFQNITNPKSYTMDISTGTVVFRYMGVEASEIAPVFNNNEMRLNIKLSALKSFSVREIATVSTITLTLKTDYDNAPNVGLVVGDLVRITKASTGATLDTIIATAGVNADGITVVLSDSAAAFAAGDTISLRPATPSYGTLIATPFLWSNTQFCFGATATAALAATQTRVEQGSTWKLMNSFEKDTGSNRSGSFDPATLVRMFGDGDATIKRFFDTPDQVNNFFARKNQALVIRHFVYSGTSTYELRITFDQINYKTGGKPSIDSSKIIYHEFDCVPVYNAANAEGASVSVINSTATV